MKLNFSSIDKKSLLTLILPLLTFSLLLSGFIWMWRETNNLTFELLKSTSKNVIQGIYLRLDLILFERSKDLSHLVSLFSTNQKSPNERFITDASGILSREKTFYSFGKLNDSGKLELRIPSDTNKYPILSKEFPLQKIFDSLSKSNPTIISISVDSKDTSKLLIILKGIFNKDSSEIMGAIYGILIINNLIDIIEQEAFPSEFFIKISINNLVIYSNETQFSKNQIFFKGAAIDSFGEMGKTWKIEVAPPVQNVLTSLLSQNNSRLLVNILSSFVVSVLLGIALYQMMKSKYIQNQLSISEKRYRLITENAEDIIYRMSLPEGQYEYISPVCEKLTGYSAREFYSKPKFLRSILDPNFTDTYDQHWSNLSKGKVPATFDYQIVHKNGIRYWLQQKNTLITDQQGHPIALEGVIADNTIQKTNEIEREKLIKELEEKNIELERFIYIVSHELKTPLITIKGFLGYLEEEAVKGEVIQLHQDIVRIILATEVMHRQLNNLININKIGRNKTRRESVNIHEIIKVILVQFSTIINQKNIHFSIGKLPAVNGYKAELFELFRNLIENAIRFSSSQTNPCVEIGTETQNEQVLFFIKDNGIGIDKQYSARIFGLFNKLDPHTEGTGAGLAIAKRVVEHHGGWIKMESEGSGKGSTFYFTLPLA